MKNITTTVLLSDKSTQLCSLMSQLLVSSIMKIMINFIWSYYTKTGKGESIENIGKTIGRYCPISRVGLNISKITTLTFKMLNIMISIMSVSETSRKMHKFIQPNKVEQLSIKRP